eukprot:TRINITY_DN826_c1_g1_i5.p1 TRINITY_DN826_c1_g1~~TRINITY_DN826_c1_g1_i5.p1  ORF type:complete len:861 (-),score=162.31 TRINITY_DN826_c1_g1_i5:43-2625(-)
MPGFAAWLSVPPPPRREPSISPSSSPSTVTTAWEGSNRQMEERSSASSASTGAVTAAPAPATAARTPATATAAPLSAAVKGATNPTASSGTAVPPRTGGPSRPRNATIIEFKRWLDNALQDDRKAPPERGMHLSQVKAHFEIENRPLRLSTIDFGYERVGELIRSMPNIARMQSNGPGPAFVHPASPLKRDLRSYLRHELRKPGIAQTGYDMAHLKPGFEQWFGYPLDYRAQGFYKLRNLLECLSDVVRVEPGGRGVSDHLYPAKGLLFGTLANGPRETGADAVPASEALGGHKPTNCSVGPSGAQGSTNRAAVGGVASQATQGTAAAQAQQQSYQQKREVLLNSHGRPIAYAAKANPAGAGAGAGVGNARVTGPGGQDGAGLPANSGRTAGGAAFGNGTATGGESKFDGREINQNPAAARAGVGRPGGTTGTDVRQAPAAAGGGATESASVPRQPANSHAAAPPRGGASSAAHPPDAEYALLAPRPNSWAMRHVKLFFREALPHFPHGFNMAKFMLAFRERFHYQLDYRQEGYLKLVNLLESIPDVVRIEYRNVGPPVLLFPGPNLAPLGKGPNPASGGGAPGVNARTATAMASGTASTTGARGENSSAATGAKTASTATSANAAPPGNAIPLEFNRPQDFPPLSTAAPLAPPVVAASAAISGPSGLVAWKVSLSTPSSELMEVAAPVTPTVDRGSVHMAPPAARPLPSDGPADASTPATPAAVSASVEADGSSLAATDSSGAAGAPALVANERTGDTAATGATTTPVSTNTASAAPVSTGLPTTPQPSMEAVPSVPVAAFHEGGGGASHGGPNEAGPIVGSPVSHGDAPCVAVTSEREVLAAGTADLLPDDEEEEASG